MSVVSFVEAISAFLRMMDIAHRILDHWSSVADLVGPPLRDRVGVLFYMGLWVFLTMSRCKSLGCVYHRMINVCKLAFLIDSHLRKLIGGSR